MIDSKGISEKSEIPFLITATTIYNLNVKKIKFARS